MMEPKLSSSTCTAARSRTEAAVMVRPQLELNLCLWKKKRLILEALALKMPSENNKHNKLHTRELFTALVCFFCHPQPA